MHSCWANLCVQCARDVRAKLLKGKCAERGQECETEFEIACVQTSSQRCGTLFAKVERLRKPKQKEKGKATTEAT